MSAPDAGASCSSAGTIRTRLFLQAMEADTSVLAEHVGAGQYRNQGERVVSGQRLMQATNDIFLGWERVDGTDGKQRDFCIRQLRDWKGVAVPEEMWPEGMELFGELCGVTPARTYARSVRRPHRDRRSPGWRQLVRPSPRHIRGGLRRPERARPPGPGRRGARRPTAHGGTIDGLIRERHIRTGMDLRTRSRVRPRIDGEAGRKAE
ncbi:hypothetical protein GCM10010306_025770 [Streptomyces umbrinus]|nr:hypothetical protein GCM10010306_025770 [Streptomyces umbrinus]